MSKILLFGVALTFFSVAKAQDPIDLDLLPPVEDLMEQVTPDADTIILCTIGGPIPTLETDYFSFYHGISTFSTVYVKQYQQYNPGIMDDSDLTLEEAIMCNDTGVAILRKVVNHFNDEGKEVVIVGHSFGGFLIPEYIDDYGNEDVHRIIPMAGRLNMNPEVWEAFATGFWAGFESDGTTPWINDEMEADDQLAGMKLMAGYGYNRQVDSLDGFDLTNLMYLHGTADEAVGGLTEEEIDFLNGANATVVTIDGGDHGAMFASSYMNMTLDFIREAAFVSTPELTAQIELNVYPTISNGTFNFETSHGGQLAVYNSAGIMINSQLINQGLNQIDLSGNETGIYFLDYITEDNQRETRKIIIR